jgi:hypothetical protein
MSMNNLASTLLAQGDLAGARALLEGVLAASRELLGERHPRTLTSMNNLAETLCAQGDLVEARGLHEEVLAARRELLGERHPDTLTSLDNLMETLGRINNLAATLQGQGDLAGARRLQEQVLAKSRELMGERHPHTTVSAWNLFNTLLQLGTPEAEQVLDDYLVWLFDAPMKSLNAQQRQIRDRLLRFRADSAPSRSWVSRVARWLRG